MGRKGRPSSHQADTIGHVTSEVRYKGKFIRIDHKWYGRCRCGWESKFTRGTKEAAVADQAQHAEEAKRRDWIHP